MFWKQLDWTFFGEPGADGGAGGVGDGGDTGGGIHGAITGAIEGMGGGDDTPAPPDPEPEDAEEKELRALEADWLAKNPNAKGNIKIHRHQAVLTRNRNLAKAEAEKQAAEWTAKEKAWQEAEQKFKQEQEALAWARDPQIAQALEAIALAESDQQKFVELLLTDPRFADIIQLKQAQAAGALSPDMPGPNKQNEDGSMYWDQDGVKALLDWHGKTLEAKSAAQSKKDMDAFKKEMEEKYGKVANAFEATTRWNESTNKAKGELERMQTQWPMFKDYQKQMKVLLDANIDQREKEYKQYGETRTPAVTMAELYIQVVVPEIVKKITANEGEMRQKLIAEMKGKPAAATGGSKAGGAVERTTDTGDRPLADVIRASIAGLKE